LPPTKADRTRARPSLLWLLLVPALLVTGFGTAVALAAVTFVDVVDEALDFGPAAELQRGEVTVWVASSSRPSDVRLAGPDDVPLKPVTSDRILTADGVDWTPGYTGVIDRPGLYRVEATGGIAALRGPDQPGTDAVRRNGIVLPIAIATVSVTLSILVAVVVFVLRASTRG